VYTTHILKISITLIKTMFNNYVRPLLQWLKPVVSEAVQFLNQSNPLDLNVYGYDIMNDVTENI